MPPDFDATTLKEINRKTWDRLASPLDLPATARLDLVDIVAKARYRKYLRKEASRNPSTSRKELRRLHGLASELVEGLLALDDCLLPAVMLALHNEPQDMRSLSLRPPPDERGPLDQEIQNLETLREQLSRASEIVKPRGFGARDDQSLRRLIAELDEFLIQHTGNGLVRSSAEAKTGRARVRIPTKPAMHSNLKPATYTDLKAATVPI